MVDTFMQNLKDVLNEEYNTSITENGAVGYRTTGKELLDINFSISSLRNMSEEEVRNKFEKVFLEDKLLAVKWLFYAADVREGVGERRLFRICMTYLANNYPEIAKAVLMVVPHYTRWDNLFVLLDTPLKSDVIECIKDQLNSDLAGVRDKEVISILGKWMPSLNTSSAETRRYARILCSGLGLTDRQYRKMLSKLRTYLKVVEVSMSAKDWKSINYEQVPSRANLIYNKAFLRNDAERRTEYLNKLSNGEAKINASVLFPQDIVTKYNNLHRFDVTCEELWKALPDYVKGEGNTICVSDGSGSMCQRIGKNTTTSCLDVAIALSIYFSERSTGQFKNKYITFSKFPQLVDFSTASNLRDKIKIAKRHSEVADTNIEAVFNLILDTAIRNNMKQEELPRNILILSDMEFNSCSVDNHNNRVTDKLFNVIRERYRNTGYLMPRLVFWNINSRTGTIPVKENELGVALVSGYSPAVVKMVLSNKLDPMDCLLEQLNSERYDIVEQLLKKVII